MRETPPDALDILIAQGDALPRAHLRLLLEGHGFTCAEAGDARETLEVARQRLPRCVLLDLETPGLDGFAVARTLRADPRTRSIHIHCLSGRGDPGARQEALEAGCEEYLIKPVAVGELLETVGRPTPAGEWEEVTGLTLEEAEDLLDWLENHGCRQLEVRRQEQAFTVRCVCPPGFRLRREVGGEVRLFEPTT
jgi:CheY-like chemotaxis protein